MHRLIAPDSYSRLAEEAEKEKHSRIRSHLFFSGLYSRFTKRLLRFVYVIIAFYFTIYNPFVKKKCHFFYSNDAFFYCIFGRLHKKGCLNLLSATNQPFQSLFPVDLTPLHFVMKPYLFYPSSRQKLFLLSYLLSAVIRIMEQTLFSLPFHKENTAVPSNCLFCSSLYYKKGGRFL